MDGSIFPIAEYTDFFQLGLPVPNDSNYIKEDEIKSIKAVAISVMYEDGYFYSVVGHCDDQPIYRTTLFEQLNQTIFMNEQDALYAKETFPKKGDELVVLMPDGTYRMRKIAHFCARTDLKYSHYGTEPDWVTFFVLEGRGDIYIPISEYGRTVFPDPQFKTKGQIAR